MLGWANMPNASGSFCPNAKLAATEENELKFASGDQQGRVSVAGTALPIWVNDSFKPVRICLITGGGRITSGIRYRKET